MTSTRYPLPTERTRSIVQRLSEQARELDAEADARKLRGSWNAVVRDEIRRAAGVVRLVATFVVNGTYGPKRAMFWITSTDAYLTLVRNADRRGVIQ
jgi:hypothetical protein